MFGALQFHACVGRGRLKRPIERLNDQVIGAERQSCGDDSTTIANANRKPTSFARPSEGGRWFDYKNPVF